MQQDSRGLPLTTANPEAAAHLERAIESFNYWKVDVMDHLGAALEADPDCPFAHTFKGIFLAGGRSEQYAGVIAASIEAARPGLADVSDRERLYFEGLEQAAAGRLMDAARKYEAVLDAHPSDLFAHRIAQQEYFWMGRAESMRDMVELAAPAWDDATPDLSMLLSCRAFGNEEALNYQAAERHGRKAVEMDPSDTWGAHAIAHVLLMQGRVEEGIDWLEGLADNWEGMNQIVHHLWWHLCLFLLEKGAHDRILSHYDDHIRNPESALVKAVPDAYIDLQNCASLLLRLELRGVDVGPRWEAIADVAEGRLDDHASPFTDAHVAMILAAAGRDSQAALLVESMLARAADDDGPLGVALGRAAIPGARAAIAHRKGDHAGVVAALMAARHAFPDMGASHAQRDIFYQMLVDSCLKSGRADLVATLIQEIEHIVFAQVAGRTLSSEAAAEAS